MTGESSPDIVGRVQNPGSIKEFLEPYIETGLPEADAIALYGLQLAQFQRSVNPDIPEPPVTPIAEINL